MVGVGVDVWGRGGEERGGEEKRDLRLGGRDAGYAGVDEGIDR